MLSFYEFNKLIESNAEEYLQKPADIDREQAARNAAKERNLDRVGGYSQGDYGEEIGEPIQPKYDTKILPSQVQKDIDARWSGSAMKAAPKGYRPGKIIDHGKHLDPETGKGHWIGKQNSGFSPGAAVPDGTLTSDMKDATSLGKQDVDDITTTSGHENQKRRTDAQRARAMNMTAGPSSALSKKIDGELDKKLDFLAQIQNVTPDNFESEAKNFLKWSRDAKSKPISKELKNKIYDAEDALYDELDKNKVYSQPELPTMAKFMARKNSKVF